MEMIITSYKYDTESVPQL